ncbi:hypothetical protein IGS68_15750 [Skermanella sp. TT6]|uniref:Uncharacterized protein n=1 Tax=Skermanella cutis TaxID=2775420 RepID=A0ABX7B1K6_9PROT|nr:hypothetical protein [Skermanella sp. TT6]QQP87554.1 hypothetical protein IGS68_15750 [Skermanella sp. TT6]
MDLDLPEFDAQARQEIWEKPLSDPPLAAFAEYPEIQAALKADRILRHLWLPTRKEREAYLNWLIAVFFSFPSFRSFEALERMAIDGRFDAPLLRDMVALKREWRRRPEWWMRRSFGSIYSRTVSAIDWDPLDFSGAQQFQELRNGQWLLSWRDARAVCSVRLDDDPIAYVDELREQWVHLDPPARSRFRDPVADIETYSYLRFIDYVRHRADSAARDDEADRLADGLWLRSRIELPV